MIKFDFTKFKPAKGKLLLSEPFSQDMNFERTVVLLAEHNEEGSIGFILNRFTEMNLGQISEEFAACTLPVFEGGPVYRDSLFYVHSLGDIIPDSIPIADNLFWSGNFETMKTLLCSNKISEKEVRLFLGYSGWNSLQLENEIKQNAWLVASSTADMVFQKAERQGKSLWRKIIKSMGKEYSIIANFPENPQWN